MSEQTSVSPCCVTGHIHEGTPLGNFEVLHGLRTYVSNSKPKETNGKQNVVVFVSDIFGVDLPNVKILADEWAGSGWKVLIPDFFNGDPVSHEHLKSIVPNLRDQEKATVVSKAKDAAVMAANLGPWLVTHREANVRPVVEKYFDDVKADPSTGKVIAVGFCWGARYALLMAKKPSKVDVVIANHPSFVVNDDLSEIENVPVAFFKGDKDAMCDDKSLNEFADILRKNKNEVSVKIYPDAVHGFAVRGDDMIESEKKQKEDAANQGMEFAKKYV